MALLAEMNVKGMIGGTANLTRARELYEKAAAKGSVEALNGLGYMHAQIDQNYTAAREIFIRAADRVRPPHSR